MLAKTVENDLLLRKLYWQVKEDDVGESDLRTFFFFFTFSFILHQNSERRASRSSSDWEFEVLRPRPAPVQAYDLGSFLTR